MEEPKKKRRKRSLVSDIILVIAIIVFLYSAYQLYTIFAEYDEGDDEYEGVAEEVIVIPEQETDKDEKEEEYVPLQVDFDKLKQINEDAVAWIYFKEPSEINYPVVQGEDNDEYLRTTIEGNTNSAGTLFVDAANSGDFSDRNTFIYGHNMKNRSMFGNLRKYKEEAYCKENSFFYIYTPDGKQAKYQIFAACIVEDISDIYQKFYADDEEFLDYLKLVRSLSLYDVDVELTATSQLVSLSTCTNVTETQRLVVVGVKISETVVGE